MRKIFIKPQIEINVFVQDFIMTSGSGDGEQGTGWYDPTGF